MSEIMVRASGGYSSQNMEEAREKGRLAGIAEAKKGNAQRTMVLSRDDNGNTITFTNSEMINAEGLMQNRGNTNITLNSRSETALIPEGYHKGNGVVSVKKASGRKNLAASEKGLVDLGDYNDYKYVDATAPTNDAYNNGYREGNATGQETATTEVMDGLNCRVANVIADHLNEGDRFQSAFKNETNYTMDVIMTAVSSRPRGDGYSHPVINIEYGEGGWSDIESRRIQYSDSLTQTNVSLETRTIRLTAGTTMLYSVKATNKGGAVCCSIAYKSAERRF